MKLLKVFVSLSLSLQGPASFANPFMEGAKDSVKAAQENAAAHADNMVQTELAKTLIEILFRKSHGTDALDQAQSLSAQAEYLENRFMEFSRLEVSNATILKADLLEKVADYQANYRSLVELTFAPTTIAGVHEQLLPTFAEAINEFDSVCRNGRASAHYSVQDMSGQPPPGYEFMFDAFLSTSPEDNRANYQSVNYRHKTRENISQGAAGIAGGAFLVAGAATGALATAALATGVVGVIVIATLAAISYFSGSAKAYKMMSQYVDAEMFKFRNLPRSQYVAEKFKESCIRRRNLLDGVRAAIHDYKNHPEQRQRFLSELQKEDLEVTQIKQRFEALKDAYCRIETSRRFEKTQDIGEGPCAIKIGANGKPNVKRDQDFIFHTERNHDLEKDLARMAKHETIRSLTVDGEEVIQRLANVPIQKVLSAQNVAFQRLTSILSNYHRVLDESDPNTTKLIKDLQVTETYEALNREIKTLVAAAIRVTFGKKPTTEFASEYTKLAKTVSSVQTTLPKKASADLQRRLNTIAKIMGIVK